MIHLADRMGWSDDPRDIIPAESLMLCAVVAALLLTQSPVSDSLTLGAALRQAREGRARLAGSAAQVAGARANRRVAGTIPNPTVSYSHTDDTPRQHLAVQQPFDWLLTRSAARAAGAAEVGRAEADSALGSAQVAAEVRRSFYGALAARRAVELTGEAERMADSVARLAARRLASGDIPQLEYEQLRLEAARAGQLLSRAREGATLAAGALARAIGWRGNEPPAPSGHLDDGLDDDRELTGPPTEGLPAVIMARADSAAAAARLSAARGARVPLPGLELGIDWSDPSLPGQTLWLFGISLPLPLWNQGGGAVALAEAERSQGAAALAEARLEARQQLAAAAARLRGAIERAGIARDSLEPAAHRLRAKAVRGYELGETGVLPVIDALRAEREIASDALEDLLAFQEALAAWNELLGIAD